MRTKWYLYVELALREIKSFDKGRYLLSYLQIRIPATERAGTFTKQMFMDATGLGDRTSTNHIKALINKKFIIQKGVGNYQIISQGKLFLRDDEDHFMYVSDEWIKSFSWKTIKKFRADLVEMINSRTKVYQRKRNRKHVYEVNQRDGHREKIENQRFLSPEWDLYISLSYASDVTGLAKSTISGYRKVNSLAKYVSPKPIIIYDVDKVKESSKLMERLYNTKGRYFNWNNKLYYSEISKRYSKVVLSKHNERAIMGRLSDNISDVTQTLQPDNTIYF